MDTTPNTQARPGALNLALGFGGLALASLGGLALGLTFDHFAVRNGDHMLSIVRFYLREGHSHGMPIALYNLIVGLALETWVEGPVARKVVSYGAALGFLLPVALVLKAILGPMMGPLGIPGAFALLASFVTALVAVVRKVTSGRR